MDSQRLLEILEENDPRKSTNEYISLAAHLRDLTEATKKMNRAFIMQQYCAPVIMDPKAAVKIVSVA